ncbi:thymidylate synthase [Burkholderia plantarii]|uniref:Thymidylate synthase ThyA n=1 Tax=Burkholderia plantarii TaxID=41899 RepID=A0A0B6SAW1_BURPL|nr:thymidylate synthase [Burkholderia plantarii]AJK50400.1 thymidylate synthase ThyA [Burkholderia plantarii]ALK34577.1 Thymidylate synthase [Burkholderia plantarii]WLE63603.1 thymidylate synthase [Burkholderia plantarii]GLZ22554.1 thymidylate synthase [Burkholderia plantarii]
MRTHFANLDELYLATLRDVCTAYEYRNAPRGQAEREIIGYSARIEDPLARFCRHASRKQNVVFNYAEALWYLSGRNDLAFIEYYAPSMARYSADGKTLPGTGYGARLLHLGEDGIDQIERAIDILKRDDAESKRVVLQIFDGREDLYKRNIDVSCTLGLQLLLRDGRLNMVAFMRANDAYVGLLNDVFSFTFLQEYLASAIGCELGTYTHHVGSVHIYDQNLLQAEALLGPPGTAVTAVAPPRMPPGCGPATIRRVLDHEARIRAGQVSFATLQDIDLDPYWRDILGLFWVYRQIRSDAPLPDRSLSFLHPFHRDYLFNRWGETLALLH